METRNTKNIYLFHLLVNARKIITADLVMANLI